MQCQGTTDKKIIKALRAGVELPAKQVESDLHQISLAL